jgi:hypothetical protein
VNPTISIQRLKSVALSCSSGRPGPLHSIQLGEDGCLYYSDELNHGIHSLDGSGRMRWQAGSKGSNPGQFHYPRGMSLGLICRDARRDPCLAVADSWNGRIQFLGLDGRFLTQWGGDSDMPFEEPVDVKFIPTDVTESVSPEGYWLVLDKRLHQLWTVDCKGHVLRQNGTCMDPDIVSRWIAPGKRPKLEEVDRATSQNNVAFNYLFYPDRIFGKTEEAIFLSEPLRRNLKLLKDDDFIPLSIGSFEDREWVAADGSGLIEWSPTDQCLQYYDGCGQPVRLDRVAGTPVPSNLPSNELWIQYEDRIDRIRVLSPSPDKKEWSPSQISLPGFIADRNILRQ